MPDFNRQLDAASVINGAAVECGLLPVNDPIGTTDTAFIQLRYLLTSCGRELITAHPWQFLVREETVSVYRNETGEYALPSDFQKLTNSTTYDTTAKQPLSGSLSPQDWRYVKVNTIGSPDTTVGFRIANDRIKIYPPPPTGTGLYFTFSYEYVSRGWVRYLDGVNTLYKDHVSANTDTVLYDSNLMIKMLRLRFLGAKGFDTTDAASQFAAAWAQATDSNTASETISLVPGLFQPLIDPAYVSNIGS